MRSARYSRHLIIPDLGVDGQKRLKNARVLVHRRRWARLADADVPGRGGGRHHRASSSSTSSTSPICSVRSSTASPISAGPKAQSRARLGIAEINPLVNVRLHEIRLDPDNAVDLFAQYDLILDGTDNFATRYLVNDAAVLAGKPYVWGSIYRFEGQVSVFWEDARPTGGKAGPELPRSLPRAAATGHGAVLRRGRRAGHPVRVDRVGDGNRGDQADHRHRRDAARAG